ncbi:SoxR reducing system RseC family protein [Candidatus Bipolaricaulota bacterium]|nr:SoxR reducing system RseC family protein [Candidatus Bipolaricaulota bacterium]
MSKNLKVRAGIVSERVENNRVKVMVLTEGDCDDCEGSCGSSDGFLTNNTFEVTALDPLGVNEGDRVRLEIEPRSFGKLAAIVFGVPVVTLLVGLGMGTVLSSVLFSGGYSKALQGGTAGLLFLGSLGGLVIYDRSLAANSSTRAEITEYLDQNCELGEISG